MSELSQTDPIAVPSGAITVATLLEQLSAPAPVVVPVGEGPSKSHVAELFYRHMGEGSEVGFENAIAEALARWGHPAAPPVAEEVAELVAWLRETAGMIQPSHLAEHQRYTRAATLLLQQQHLMSLCATELESLMEQQLTAPAPVVVAVAVAERLPEEGDCDELGRCWLLLSEGYDGTSRWIFVHFLHASDGEYTHWLPAHAIPLPQAGEVQE